MERVKRTAPSFLSHDTDEYANNRKDENRRHTKDCVLMSTAITDLADPPSPPLILSTCLHPNTQEHPEDFNPESKRAYGNGGISSVVVGVQILLDLQHAELHLLKETVRHDLKKEIQIICFLSARNISDRRSSDAR